MRINAGHWKGTPLTVPKGLDVRPTSDRARAALFDVLLHRFNGADGFCFDGISVLDVFAGSGAVGLEALSRGAGSALFIENAAASLSALRSNIQKCGAEDATTVLRADAMNPPKALTSVGLAFLDPPYKPGVAEACLQKLSVGGWFAPGALVCVETDTGHPEPAWPDSFTLLDQRRQGRARMSILHYASASTYE